MEITKHAEKRMQQRSIPRLIVDWLDGYGSTEKAPGNAAIVFFDRKARKELSRDFGRPAVDQLSRYLNTYMIRKRSRIITVGYRNKHLNREMKYFG